MSDTQSLIPVTLRILGLDEDERVVIWALDTRRLFYLRDIDSLSVPKLVLYGGDEAYEEAVSIIKMGDPKINPLSVIKRCIAAEARSRVFSAKESFGQGIWRLPNEPGLLLVSGNRAVKYRPATDEPWTILSAPLIENRLVELNGASWVDPSQLWRRIQAQTPDTQREVWNDLLGRLASWRFSRPHDALLIAGLIVATSIQAAWEFRPQVWVVGPTDAGKTVLKTMLAGIWPHADQCENESSEASVRQTIGRDSMPLLLDEQEQSPSRNKLIKTMRSGTRGGTITRGTTTGKPMVFRVNHISWWYSVEYHLPRAADRNRFAVFELAKQEQFVMPSMDGLGELGLELLACAMKSCAEITAVWRELSKLPSVCKYGRLSEVYALPLAVCQVMTGESMLATFHEVMEAQGAAMQEECPSDEQDLINAILMACPPGDQSPISVHLRASTHDKRWVIEDRTRVLEECGLRKHKSGYVFVATEVIKRKLLAGTKWADTNVKLMLRRIEGAVEDKQRVNGMNVNGVSIPLKLLMPELSEQSASEPALKPAEVKPKKGYRPNGLTQYEVPERDRPDRPKAQSQMPSIEELYAALEVDPRVPEVEEV